MKITLANPYCNGGVYFANAEGYGVRTISGCTGEEGGSAVPAAAVTIIVICQ